MNNHQNNHQSEFYQIEQPSVIQLSIQIPTSPVEKPSKWMQDGTSPTEIILANAVLVMAISSVIIATRKA